MKKLIVIIVCFFTNYIYAQNQSILNINTNIGNGQYKARDEVKVTNGNIVPSGTGEAHLFIDPNLIVPTNYVSSSGGSGGGPSSNSPGDMPATNYTVDYSLPNIPFEGGLDVSGSGALVYNLPIYTPVGINKMEPSMSISYSSQSGSGLFGLGWNLNGLSYISRGGKNNFNNNGISKAVSYTNNDYFYYNGSRLIPVTGNNGEDGTVYTTEEEQYVRIISHSTGTNGPESFTIETRSGMVYEFGTNNNSKVIPNGQTSAMHWMINKISDRYNNYILYKYRVEENQTLIDEILYTCHAGINPANKIKFYYTNKTDNNQVYQAGASISDNVIIEKIVVSVESVIMRTYTFEYAFYLNNTYLNKVKVFNKENETLNPIAFDYGTEDVNSTSIYFNRFATDRNTEVDAEFSYNIVTNKNTVYKNTLPNLGIGQIPINDRPNNTYKNLLTIKRKFDPSTSYNYPCTNSIFINVQNNIVSTQNYYYKYWHRNSIVTTTNTPTTNEPDWMNYLHPTISSHYNLNTLNIKTYNLNTKQRTDINDVSIATIDINGDGLEDVFGAAQCTYPNFTASNIDYLLTLPFNATTHSNGSAAGTPLIGTLTLQGNAVDPFTFQLLNLNNDGKTDLIIARHSGSVEWYFGSATGFVLQNTTTTLGKIDLAKALPIDEDGDGINELVNVRPFSITTATSPSPYRLDYNYNAPAILKFNANNSSPFTLVYITDPVLGILAIKVGGTKLNIHKSFEEYNTSPNAPSTDITSFIADFNGDGITDFLKVNHPAYLDRPAPPAVSFPINKSKALFASVSTVLTPCWMNVQNGDIFPINHSDYWSDDNDYFAKYLTTWSDQDVIHTNNLGLLNTWSAIYTSTYNSIIIGTPHYPFVPIWMNSSQTIYPAAHNDFIWPVSSDSLTLLSNNLSDLATLMYSNSVSINNVTLPPTSGNFNITTDFYFGKGNGTYELLSGANTAFGSTYSNGKTIQQAIDNGYVLTLGDINNDGKTDVLDFKGIDNTAKVFYSTGKNFVATNLTIPGFQGIGTATISQNVSLADYNSDGFLDIIAQGEGFNNGGVYIGTLRHGLKTNKITKVASAKSVLNIAYGNASFELPAANLLPANYSPITFNYPYAETYSPFTTVKTLTGYGSGSIVDKEYNFSSAVLHLNGKGFLGFQKTSVSNKISNVVESNYYKLNPSYPILNQEIALTNKLSFSTLNSTPYTGALVSRTDNSYTFAQNTTGSYSIFSTGQTNTNLLSGATASTTSTFNATTGNILTNTSNVNSIENSVETFTYATHGTFTDNCLMSKSITATRGTETPFTQTTTYEYTSDGIPIKNHAYSDSTHLTITTEYFYDPNYGLPIGSKISSLSDPSKNNTNTYTYASNKRFATVSTNKLGEATTSVYNNLTGQLKQITTPDGNTTKYTYDNWGRPVTTEDPTGAIATIETDWCNGGNCNVSFPSGITAPVGGIVEYTRVTATQSPTATTYYNKLGQAVFSETSAFGGNIYSASQYDATNGRLDKQTNAYKVGSGNNPPNITSYAYDPNMMFRQTSQTTSIGSSQLVTITALVFQGNGVVKNTVTMPDNKTKTTIIDASGKTIEVKDDNQTTLVYAYNSSGTVKNVKINNKVKAAYTYDGAGRQKTNSDPSSGTTNYKYNSAGQLLQEIDGKGNKTEYFYTPVTEQLDKKILTPTNGAAVVTYMYEYVTTGNGKHNIKKMYLMDGSHEQKYTYGAFNRLTSLEDNYINLATNVVKSATYTYTYDQFGKVISTACPMNVVINNVYDGQGFLTEIKNGSQSLWQAQAMNAQGTYTNYMLGNGITTTNTYDQAGYLSESNSGNVFHYQFDFDPLNGNLLKRKDEVNQYEETFGFDNLDRLTTSTYKNLVTNATNFGFDITYNTLGQITNTGTTTNPDLGAYEYNIKGAVKKIDNPINKVPITQQEIEYTGFNSIAKITEGTHQNIFHYGVDDARRHMEIQTPNSGGTFVTSKNRYYFGDYELEEDVLTNTSTEVLYVSAPTGLCAAIVNEQSQASTHYLYTDHLGSIMTVTDNTGNVELEQSFDAWGNKRDPSNWGALPTNSTALAWLWRGYTMHEHLDDYKLINMNGRMYDPVLRQMLSPDPVLQDPSNTQNYNKYAYVFNNPLKYTDPSGFIGTPMASGESMQQWSIRTIFDKYGNGLGGGGGRGGGAGYGDEGGYNVDGMPASAHQMMLMTTKLVHKEVYDADNNKISDEFIRVSNGLIEGMSVLGDCSEYGLESGMSYNPNNGQVFDVAATTNNEYLAAEIRAGEVEKNSNGQYVAIYNHEYGGLAGWKGGVKEGSKPMTFHDGEGSRILASGLKTDKKLSKEMQVRSFLSSFINNGDYITGSDLVSLISTESKNRIEARRIVPQIDRITKKGSSFVITTKGGKTVSGDFTFKGIDFTGKIRNGAVITVTNRKGGGLNFSLSGVVATWLNVGIPDAYLIGNEGSLNFGQ